MYPAYRGSAWHAELEQHAAPDTIAEARFHIDLPGLGLFSGSPDLLDVGRGILWDYKTTKEVPRFDRAWGSAIEQMQINRWLVDNATAVEYNGQWIGDFELAIQLGKAHVPQSVNMTPKDFRPFDWQHLILVYLDNNGPKPIRTWKSIQVPTKVEGKTKPARVDDIWDDERVEKLIEERYSAAHDALVGRNIPAIPGPDWANGKAPLCAWCSQKSMCIDMQHEGK